MTLSLVLASLLLPTIFAWQHTTRPNRFASIHSMAPNRNFIPSNQTDDSTSSNQVLPPSAILHNIDQPSILHIVQRLIDSVHIESNGNRSAGSVLYCADRLKRLHKQFKSDQLASICLQYGGIQTHFNKRFELYSIVGRPSKSRAIDAEPGRLLCSVRLQQNVRFGPKAVRFAFYQSLNKRNPTQSNRGRGLNSARHIWLSDDLMWLGATLKPIGKLHTFRGWAILWRQTSVNSHN
jgi:hypothetical protein